jgi:hypothetical protein
LEENSQEQDELQLDQLKRMPNRTLGSESILFFSIAEQVVWTKDPLVNLFCFCGVAKI